ncbi:ATP sulfurylase [Caldisphaera lagunensis DSM 15908]|uniref:Sulfate adenylyltransferase n=1 Tax=Caldisphaera lagunensis (strain DSM 15908 / JCM 11604 / ANMR 0165 / IC-154) TaxID=1056495 RepID=L0ABI1_CALLD|nr:sulfate adenylyltransferase [Caldisphaera lagunensis]AFZ70779.1 ATP sulfurylase [Caldisphaera lagunensis DSM 15908]
MVSKPHGGRLIDRTRTGKSLERLQEDSEKMLKINVNEGRAYDIENIAHGVYSPLEGFMGYNDYESVLKNMRLENDIPWTIPIILDVDNNDIANIKEGDEVVLSYNNINIAILRVEEIFSWDKKEYAYYIYKTKSVEHPGVEKIYNRKDKIISGPITLLRDIPEIYENVRLFPKDTRVLFDHLNMKNIAAFQTRNAPHMGHEYVMKAALTFVDGLFINPLLGWKKKGDFVDDVIVNSYKALLNNYFPKDSYVFSILRMEMNYAGPKEAIHHAIIRKNFGATHIIIGRDHAGVGDYYAPYESWRIFEEFPDLGITPLFIREAFYCKKCKTMTNDKICPHSDEDRIKISGTQIRNLIMKGERPSEYIMRPEVVDVILSYKNPFF